MFKEFSILNDAKLAHNYLTKMVDDKYDFLPYWLVAIQTNPAFAKHCRVDDAELVASWYEGLACSMDMLNTDDGKEVLEGFKKHLLKSWGEDGLRYHEVYPWSQNTMHCSFHEMGYVLSGLVRLLKFEPDNEEAKKRIQGLVKALRNLVIRPKYRAFWSGESKFDDVIYYFPKDLYIKNRGWDNDYVTGRGEECVRNAVILQGLTQAYELLGDEDILDLAVGIANYMLGLSRYFNWKGEFLGHVHSTMWFCGGLAHLGRLTGNDFYIECAKGSYDYVLSISSKFGWVPEYAQWHPDSEERCETCCIRDMIDTGFELIACGYDEYWDVINKFTRNQLTEQQIKEGSFVGCDETLEDSDEATFKNLAERVVGGYSGGGEPNCLSLSRFRSIAGCCIGTAPQALHRVYQNIVTENKGEIYVNLPISKEDKCIKIDSAYPNSGSLSVTVKQDMSLNIRLLDFMKEGVSVKINGADAAVTDTDVLQIGAVKAGDVVVVTHDMKTFWDKEHLQGSDYSIKWCGPDVVDIEPKPDKADLRLYQRDASKLLEVPPSPERKEIDLNIFLAKPTEQKRQKQQRWQTASRFTQLK